MNALVSVRSPQTSFLPGTSLVQVDECLGSNNLAFIHTSQRSTKTLKCRRSLIIQAGYQLGMAEDLVARVSLLVALYWEGLLLEHWVAYMLPRGWSVGYETISETVEISKALAGADRKDLMRKLPKFIYDEEKALERTRKILTEKIAQLNSAIDDVSAQLRADDEPNGAAITPDELEASI